MVPDSYHDFFVASASAAGALVGLLFVALSIFQDRDDERERVEAHSLRASAAFTAFSNALVISLFALLPADELGETGTIVSALGVAFVIASALRLVRLRRGGVPLRRRDLIFITGAAVLFGWQMLTAIRLWIDPHQTGYVDDLSIIVVISFTYGIARAWELIGGPQVGVVSEVSRLLANPSLAHSGAGVHADGQGGDEPAPEAAPSEPDRMSDAGPRPDRKPDAGPLPDRDRKPDADA